MMKRMKRTLSLLLCLLTALALPVAALAAGNPTVDYTGQTDQFVFSNVGTGSSTDLFAGFKNVMPRDSLTQKIDIANSSAATVRIYLRQEPVDEAHRAFLDQLHLTVTSDVGATRLYEEAPGEQDGLATNVLLGTFLPGAKITLTAELTVPITMGNEFENQRGDVVWVFTVEELSEPAPTPTPKPAPGPATGDATNLLPWLLIGLAMVIAIVALVLLRRRASGSR